MLSSIKSIATTSLVAYAALFGACLGALEGIDARPAVGFHLGQSYGTAVVHLNNKTTINLAKIKGSSRYIQFMQQEVQRLSQPPSFSPFAPPEQEHRVWRSLKRLLGLKVSVTESAHIVGEMISSLKVLSEAQLGTRLYDTVAITAPWMEVWNNDVPFDSLINDALKFSGLQAPMLGLSSPLYIGEASAVLAANGHAMCPETWCANDDRRQSTEDVVYYISLTNESLYTSFQDYNCFDAFQHPARLSLIEPELGFANLESQRDQEIYWKAIENHVHTRLAQDAQHVATDSAKSYVVLVSGEATDRKEFGIAVKRALKKILGGADAKSGAKVAKSEANQLVESPDPTFAAARGAAFWMWRSLSSDFCAEHFDGANSKDQHQQIPKQNEKKEPKTKADGHSEL